MAWTGEGFVCVCSDMVHDPVWYIIFAAAFLCMWSGNNTVIDGLIAPSPCLLFLHPHQ